MFHLLKKVIPSIKKHGIKATLKKILTYRNRFSLHITRKISIPRTKIVIQKRRKILFPKLLFPLFDTPLVSIIIPVYNQFNYTYNCLSSILNNSTNIKYEIIIADDKSSDKTKKIEDIVKNIKIIRNNNNLGFLKNCNYASNFAKGKYLLFLNNDTEVQTDWLFYLLKLIENDEKIGLVGSKLVYPDRKLQEAGGIIWSDGSGCNYGHSSNIDLPEYNYVKDVDYISGASILIRREIWEKIGGFDERFSPAYCEDSDLAFSVRELGYRVVFQPASVVVHFEGVSHGTDTKKGVKSHQIINQKKLFEKWQNVLEREYFSPRDNYFLPRGDRGKKIILVIEQYIPYYDKDAGSRTIFLYIKLFLQLGLKVVFLSDDTIPYQPYTFTFQQMGVEVLYGEYFSNNWKIWLKENGKFLDYIFTCRSNVSIKYIDYLIQNSTAKIIYYNHDMSHIRYKRQAEITGDQNIMNVVPYYEKMEMEVSSKADVLYVVGSHEKNIINNLFPNKPVYNIPAFFYEKIKESSISIKDRKNLLFVGGYDHVPNEDAVIWFYENAFSEIISVYPDVIWFIVGNKPTKKMLSLQNKNIVITGYVSYDELEYYYYNCRIFAAPLRFGAGVKGKLLDAAYYGIPLITTEIGAEGISREENAFIVNPTDATFAKKIIELYKDEERLEELSLNCSKLINNHFLIDRAIEIVKKEINV
jgi:GT2 family glycosyltransferase